MAVPRAILWLSLLTFAGFGLAFTAAPRGMAGLVDIPLSTDTALVDFAATYGGFELGFAVFLGLCSRRDAWVRFGLLASGCALTGFAVVRLGGILLSPNVKAVIWVVLAAEVAGALLSFWGARRAEMPRG